MHELSISSAITECGVAERCALVERDRIWSYAELAALVARLRQALEGEGIVPGLRVAFVARPELATVATLMALFEIGAAQAAVVSGLLAAEGLESEVFRDLGGRDRCVAVKG